MPSFPTVIDNSMLNEFRSCPQSFFRSYIEQWKPKAVSVHLHAGGAFARGLEVARRAYFDEGQPPEDAVAAGLDALIRAYGDYLPPPDSAKSLERTAGAFEYYFSVWPFEVDKAVPVRSPVTGRHAIEFSFVEPLDIAHPETGEPLLYSGKSDAIVRIGNGTFICDEKTTSSLGAAWQNKWEMRSQFTGYCWGAQRRGQQVDGVLVRGVSILKTKYDHAQAITYRPQWEIDRWYRQTLRDIHRMKQLWAQTRISVENERPAAQAWDYNLGEACDQYGGCKYVSACKTPSPYSVLELYFERRHWDPVSHTESAVDEPLTAGWRGEE